ncbi:hypothetical protein QK908_01655 [Lactococcus cremoris]
MKVGKLTDKYVVLQAAQEVPASLKKVLDKDYKVSNYSGKYFQVYQRNKKIVKHKERKTKE